MNRCGVSTAGQVVPNAAGHSRGVGKNLAEPRIEPGFGSAARMFGGTAPGSAGCWIAREEKSNAVGKVEPSARSSDDVRIGWTFSLGDCVHQATRAPEVAPNNLEDSFGDRDVAERVGEVIDSLQQGQHRGLIGARRRKSGSPVSTGRKGAFFERSG